MASYSRNMRFILFVEEDEALAGFDALDRSVKIQIGPFCLHQNRAILRIKLKIARTFFLQFFGR